MFTNLNAANITATDLDIRDLTSVQDSVTAVGPLTDAELRATPVPISGTITATPTGTQDVNVTATSGLTDTQLRATPVPISGTVSTTTDLTRLIWDTDTDFNLGTIPSTLEVSGSGAAAQIQPKEIADNNNNIDFTTSGDYTLSDATNIEVLGGQAQLKEVLPSNGTFFAKYGSSIDADFASGSITGTATGGASVSGGKLDLTGGTLKYVSYDADLNADSQQTGCIRFKYTPNYTGTPASNRTPFTTSAAAGDPTNTIRLRHTNTGQLALLCVDFLDITAINVNIGAFSPTAGTEYEIELDYDFTAGATRLFIDGVQLGATITTTLTRDTSIGLLRIGSSQEASTNSDFSIDNFMVFSTVQHTANYTPSSQTAFYSTTDNLYVETKDASQVAPSNVASWLTTTFTSSTPTNTDIRVLFSTDDRVSWLTWNGSSWAAPNSATTRTDATTLSNATTNFASLGLGSGLLDVRVFLFSSDGVNQPNVSNINVTSDAGYETSGVYTTNIADTAVQNADWNTLSLASVVPSGTALTIKARASNDSANMGTYSSALTNHSEINLTGRYIQFEVTFAGTASARPQLQAVGAYVTLNITDLTP